MINKHLIMKNLQYSLLLLFALSLVSSCTNEIEDFKVKPLTNSYYPLRVGSSWTYELDSIIYDDKGATIDTFHGIIKEVLSDSFVNSVGKTAYLIERYNKKGNNWEVSDIWSTYKTENQALRSEDNLTFIKMVTPIDKKQTWDGNEYIDTENLIVKIAGESIKMYEQWYYRYLDIDIEETIGENTYSNVVVVQQVDKETKLEKRYSVEKYAKNIGLVYKKMIILNTQNNNESIPWEKKAEEGFILEQKLISYSR